MLRIDDKIADYFVNTFCVLRNFHPNAITIFGMMMNIIFFLLIYYPTIGLAVLCLTIRYLADVLDGAVARKYNKKSKIGGLLDTTSDFILSLIVLHLFILKFNLNKLWYLVYISGYAYTVYCYDSFVEHESLKQKKEETHKNIIPFFTNNTILLYIPLMIAYYCIYSKRLRE